MRAVPLHPVPTPASQKTRVQIWLFENTDMRIEGRIIVSCLPWTRGLGAARACCACADEEPTWQGFDEYMNLVLDDAEEMSIKKKSRKPLGERLLPEHTLGGRVRVPQRRLHVRLPRSLTTPSLWQGGFCSRGTTLRS